MKGHVKQFDDVRTLFDSTSAEWEAIYRRERRWRGRDQNFISRLRLVGLFVRDAAGDLLDVGCGAGITTLQLCHPGVRRVVGIDISEQMIARARRILSERTDLRVPVEFRVERAESIDAADASFDIVTALGVLEYVDDPLAFLKEISRVLRPEGIAVITVPHRYCPFRWWERVAVPRLKAPVRPAVRFLKYSVLGKSQPNEVPVHHASYSRRTLGELSARANFVVDRHGYCTVGANSIETILPLGGPATRLLDRFAENHWISWIGSNLVVKLKRV